jgi:hypothetical protein
MTDQEYLEVTREPTNNLRERLIVIIVENQTTMRQIGGIEYEKTATRKRQDISSNHRGAF